MDQFTLSPANTAGETQPVNIIMVWPINGLSPASLTTFSQFLKTALDQSVYTADFVVYIVGEGRLKAGIHSCRC